MIQHLKELYPDHIVHHPSQVSSPEKYVWFYTNRYDIIGLPNDYLGQRERGLLNTFLKRVPIAEIDYNNKEKQWAAYLNDHADGSFPPDTDAPYRFHHFSLSHAPDEPLAFTEAFRNAFPLEGHIIWNTDTEGVIISRSVDHDPETNLLSFLRALEGDFLIDICMYQASQHQDLHLAKKNHQREYERFQTFKQLFPGRILFTSSEEALIDLFKESEHIHLGYWQRRLLNDTDKELLETVHVYLQSQLNLSKAAKRLHIHRNTLQYRLDKFQEINGPLLNHFTTMVSTYIALWLTGEFSPFVHSDENHS
ncbi:DNA-binding protein Fis [Geomicrobium halophilum]|uniref:DNA-binding protein Fis n=1 Tax=Geomicrobium halophilum TaxID=549000 RepID=A0A841Q130_9BACL|nr:helix-turn-helix domain-containing protein [Geomicrobium halophilum]MBB6451255.1 DNA-binding protein Fis [Geomicrobium halophilum]